MRIQRKRLLDRTTNVRDATLYVVATEGEKTEKAYFALFGNSRVRIVVLPTDETGPVPARATFSTVSQTSRKRTIWERGTNSG